MEAGVAERGGAATQEGIYYQNTIAARYLADLLELSQQPPRDRVVEVRVEAPADVDDIVVRYADGHRDWIQVKTDLTASGEAWGRLWENLGRQRVSPQFGAEDRLLVTIGEPGEAPLALREMCARAETSVDLDELQTRLTKKQKMMLVSVLKALGDIALPIEVLRRTTIEIKPLSEVEREFSVRRLGSAFSLPIQLLSNLRDIAGGGARRKQLFVAPLLRQRLKSQFGVDISEPLDWGLSAYRATVLRLSRLDIPGTGRSGSSEELFIWPRASEYQTGALSDFEDEIPGVMAIPQRTTIELQDFPCPGLDRCVIVAGPGHGKSALLQAVAARLTSSPYVPVVVPLPSFADRGAHVLDYINNEVNREMNIRADWNRLAEQGLLVLLFDGLDEIPAGKRRIALGNIATFSARFPSVPWLLTVRDPVALSGPIDAQKIELLPLDESDIERFLKTAKSTLGTRGDVDRLMPQLRNYPDLQRLTRIPLFLMMLVALIDTAGNLPNGRADLIELYLKTLFSPFEHKPIASDGRSSAQLRHVAEALAFERLEKQEIGATEREVLEIAARISTDSEPPESVLSRLQTHGVLRRQSALRLQFPYPIVQEYLAACHLIREQPELLAHRISDAIQRPWAQVIQFALELHDSPQSLLIQMMNQNDDAFATGLRLVGRCVVNGATVSAQTRVEIARRLTVAWGKATWRNCDRIGRLLIDGFCQPLIPELRQALHNPWLWHNGAGEIIQLVNDPELTESVFNSLFDRNDDRLPGFYPLMPALSQIGEKVFEICIDISRRNNVHQDHLEDYGWIISSLDPTSVSGDRIREISNDESLPDVIRLSALSMRPHALSSAEQELMTRTTRSDAHPIRTATWRLLGRLENAEEVVMSILRDESVPMPFRCELADFYSSRVSETNTARSFEETCVRSDSLPPIIRDRMRVLFASHGDREAFDALVVQISTLQTEIAGGTLSLLSHYPELEVGVSAADSMRIRVKNASEAVYFARNAVVGLTYRVEMHGLSMASLHPARRHPATDVWRDVIEGWLERYDATSVEHISLLTDAAALGSHKAIEEIEAIILNLDPDAPDFDAEDGTGQAIRSAIEQLLAARKQLPLSTAERLVRAKRANVPFAGIDAIASRANTEALDLMIRLYNEGLDWPARSGLADSIEVLSGRLGVTVRSTAQGLTVQSPAATSS